MSTALHELNEQARQTSAWIARLRQEVALGRNPKQAKLLLAREIPTRFHDAAAAERAAADFELRARGGKSNTEVVTIDADSLGIESTADEHIASVKFDGTLKVDGEIERVSEVWNLAKPVRGGGWVLAGIQQLA